MEKTYVLDTNVLLDAPNAVKVLQNDENKVCITWTVLQELDKLKGQTKTRHKAVEAIKALEETPKVTFLHNTVELSDKYSPDDCILHEIKASELTDPILVTNDLMLRLKAQKIHGIQAQPYKEMVPFKAESQKVTGFSKLTYDAEGNEEIETIDWNCFYWKEGKLYFYSRKDGHRKIDYENTPWGISPKTPYQNAALELMLDPTFDLVTVQSEAGFGKTFLSLASALYLAFEEKFYKKIYVLKPNIEIGQELGFLPGGLDEKLDPYFRNVHNLLLKLHEKRPCNRAFKKDIEDLTSISSVNKNKFEYVPLNFLRGMEFSDCVVIIDETQNLTKDQLKTVLSRMGENVKCFCTGDTEQVDNPACNPENNGLNWAVKLFHGEPNYAHIVLKGTADRGPICSLVRKCWK